MLLSHLHNINNIILYNIHNLHKTTANNQLQDSSKGTLKTTKCLVKQPLLDNRINLLPLPSLDNKIITNNNLG